MSMRSGAIIHWVWMPSHGATKLAAARPGSTPVRFPYARPQETGHRSGLHELLASSHSYLYLDAAQHGLGSRACGPDVWPEFALRPEARTLVLRIAAL